MTGRSSQSVTVRGARGGGSRHHRAYAGSLELSSGDELQYGGRVFERASRLLRQLTAGNSLGGRAGAVLQDPAGLGAVVQVMRSLPHVDVAVGAHPAGSTLRAHLDERRYGVLRNRIAQGVLVLPNSMAEYLSGRRRQALRTNLRRAEDLDVRCCQVPPEADRRRLLKVWLEKRPDLDPPRLLEQWLQSFPTKAEWWAAGTERNPPLAIGVVTIDSDWALMHTLVSHSHPARWMLHTRMVLAAMKAGARGLLVINGNALLLPPNLQYFQRLLGYRVAHLHGVRDDAVIVPGRRNTRE